MTKVEFLKHLEKLLHVLNEKERSDILSEYTQHIDSKVESSGMSEEAAIKDFGNVNELACEILDAYNVNPNYKKITLTKFKDNWEKLCLNVSDMFNRIGSKSKKMCSSTKDWWDRMTEKLKSTTEAIHKPVVKKSENKKEARQKMGIKVGINEFGSYVKQALRFIGRALVVIFLVPIVLAEFLLIVVLGILIVLVFTGYPVIGFTIVTVGLLMCATAVLWLAGRFLLNKKVVQLCD